jgi:hypothetical protein
MKILIIITSIFALSGCFSMDALTSSNKAPADTSYYVIDSEFRFLCLGNSKRCYDMTKVVSSRTQLQPIEVAYNAEVKAPNYPVSLMRILMKPSDGSYSATPIGTDGRFFKIPKNTKTDIAWETLTAIYNDLFMTGS